MMMTNVSDGEDSSLPTPIKDRTGKEGHEVLTAVSKADIMRQEDDDMDDDKVAEYWSSDHHKFEWSGYMQSLNPRSWHALGLGVPESFLAKGWCSFSKFCQFFLFFGLVMNNENLFSNNF